MVKKVSLVDQIYEQTRKDIIDLAYPLGSRLSISELQEKYGVSSTPVREALNRLQREGLVEYENNVGARVITLSPKDVMEIQQLALVLHTAAIDFSMNNGNNEVMAAEILQHIEEYKKADDVITRTYSVHHLVGVFYKYCENKRLDANMGFIKGQQLILRNLYGSVAKPGDSSIDNFMEMYHGVLAGDKDRVIAALMSNENKAMQATLEKASL